jgi:hypothetical protein
MQDALQQVFRAKDAAFREKDTENAFSETPLEAKSGEMCHIMVLVTESVTGSKVWRVAPHFASLRFCQTLLHLLLAQ